MNRSKKLYMLLGILAAVGVVTFGVCKYQDNKEMIKNSDEIILELASDEVTSLSWKYGSDTFAFHKDESWIYDGDEAFPVNEEKINELLQQFESFGVSFIIEEVEDYSQYGLDNPVCTINIETADETYEILVGNYSTMDSERYVSIGDGNVYLVQNDPADYFNVTLSDMIEHDDILDYDTVNAIQFAGSENYKIFYEEDSVNTYCEEDVYFTEQNGSTLPLDTSRVDDYLQAITSMELTDYVTYNASEEDLATYGLDHPELTVNVEYTTVDDETEEETTDTFVLSISRDPEEIRDAERAKAEETEVETESETEEETTAYVRIGGSRIIYQITSDKYEVLMDASYDALRHQEVLSVDLDTVHQIDITLEGVDYTITSEGEGDERVYYYGEKELELADFNSAINALEADRFTDEEPTQKEEISLTVYLDNENYPEVHIELYRYDGSYCLAVVDGEPVSLVERTNVVDLIEAVNAIVLN